MVIYTLDIDKMMCFVNDMTVCSCNATIGTTINEGSCFVGVSQCRNMVGSLHYALHENEEKKRKEIGWRNYELFHMTTR